jgi:hypothetical protein
MPTLSGGPGMGPLSGTGIALNGQGYLTPVSPQDGASTVQADAVIADVCGGRSDRGELGDNA